MRSRGLIVAIDGPAGAGKTTAAQNLAKRLGYLYLDTGATFRAVAWKALQDGVSPADPVRLEAISRDSEIRFVPDRERILIDGQDITDRIRARTVAEAASRVALHPGVRQHLTALWRRIAADGGVIVEGRDIGTVVFPDAELKFFLVADPHVRAERRYRDLAEPGLTREQVSAELERRDETDRARPHAPLLRAPDAIVVDTTRRTPAETLERMERAVRARLEGRPRPGSEPR